MHSQTREIVNNITYFFNPPALALCHIEPVNGMLYFILRIKMQRVGL